MAKRKFIESDWEIIEDSTPTAQAGILIPPMGQQYMSGATGDMSSQVPKPDAQKKEALKVIQSKEYQNKIKNQAQQTYVGPTRKLTDNEKIKAKEQRIKLNSEYIKNKNYLSLDEDGNIINDSKYLNIDGTSKPHTPAAKMDKFAESWETPLTIATLPSPKTIANLAKPAINKVGKYLMPKNLSPEELVDLYRIQEKDAKTFSQLAAEGKIPKIFNNEKTIAKKTEEEKYFGQWFTKDKADLDWYTKDREFTNPEIINLKVPKSKLSQYQNYDKSLSRAPEREFVVPHAEQKLYNDFKSEIITPQGFQNRVFDSNIQLGEFSGKGHLSEKGFNYRTLSEKELEAIKSTKGVFPKQGKAKGGNENVKYWTKGNEKNWYADNPNQQVIRVRENKFTNDKVVNAADVEFFNHQTGKFEPISNFKPNNFKSEIDWAKWNKEIPDNPSLLNEYNTIEQTSKANGTWMKNPDGSKFQGSPEQFIQQNSQNFKKAFGKSKVLDKNGNVQIAKHTTGKKFDEFDMSKFGSSTDEGFYGKGMYFHPKSNEFGLYGDNEIQAYLNIQKPASKDVIPFFGRTGRGKKALNTEYHNNEDLWKGKYDGVIADPKTLERNYMDFNDTEYVTNIPSNIKSAIGNNGMFDMSNPNIYKALIPAAVAGAASQQETPKKGFKNGGRIESDWEIIN